jgi:hypothetical protein
MPLQDANELVSDTSDDTNLDEAFETEAGNGAVGEGNGAESSDAHDEGQGERSALDVVQDVVKQRDPEAAASSAEAKKEGDEADPKATQAAKEPDDENYTDVGFHKHPRFQQLLREKKANQADAERYRNVEGFLRQHRVPAEEASQALTIAALLRNDPVKAWQTLKPIVQQLLVDAGEVLPQDLKGRVESGELTVEAANEIAKERASRTSVERRQKTAEEQQEEDRAKAHVDSLRTAANTWDAERKAKDPNFEAKRQKIMKELAWIHTTEGKADTPEGVRKQLDAAYKAVGSVAVARSKTAAPLVGDATRKRPVSNGSASQTQQSDQQDEGVMKHIRAVVAQRGAAAA